LSICFCSKKEGGGGKQRTEIADDMGRRITFDAPPARIISLAPSVTEMLFAVGAADRLVGVTNFCDYPPEVKFKTKVGGMTNPSLEKIVELKPDLIIITMEGNTKEDFDKLDELGLKIFVTNPRNFAGIMRSILDIGKITGYEKNAQDLVDQLKTREANVERLVEHLSKPKVFILMSIGPVMTAGKNTFVHEMVEKAGGVNIAGTQGITYPQLNREEVVKQDPDVIIAPSDLAPSVDYITNAYPEWKTLKAAKANRVYLIDANSMQRPGPRFVDGLEEITKAIHPEIGGR
jgi:iron complex transport system substrate-binding protein